MFGKLIKCVFLFFFNLAIYVAIDTLFEIGTGQTLVPKAYELLYMVAAAVTVYYQLQIGEAKKAKLTELKGAK